METVMLNKILALSIAVMIIVIGWLVLIPHKTNVAFIDLQRALSRPASMLSKTSLEKKTQQKILKQYASRLSSVIHDYGKTNNLTIVSGQLLTNNGGQDITDQIVAITLKKVREDA